MAAGRGTFHRLDSVRRIETQVIVIGGGATGSGVLRDLSLRGVKAVLVEKNDLASGTTRPQPTVFCIPERDTR